MAQRRRRIDERKKKGPAEEAKEEVGQVGGSDSGGGSSSSGGGGGSSGGGTSSSGGSSSSGPSVSQAQAQKKALRVRRFAALQALRQQLHGLGLPVGPLNDTLKRLVKKNVKRVAGTPTGAVSEAEMLHGLMRDKQFKKMFPGIDKIVGNITTGKLTVAKAVDDWGKLANAYVVAQQQLGIDIGLDKKKIGFLITNNVSSDEFTMRLMKWQAAQGGALDQFNIALQASGQQPLSIEQFMTMPPKDFADLHEAVALQQMGLGSAEARAIARSLGVMGQETDLSALPEALSALRGQAGQEFAQLGLGTKELALAALSDSLTGVEKEQALKFKSTIEQQLKNRQAALQSRGGVQPRQGPRGEPLLPAQAGAGVQSL
jgi:hypothetical protein